MKKLSLFLLVLFSVNVGQAQIVTEKVLPSKLPPKVFEENVNLYTLKIPDKSAFIEELTDNLEKTTSIEEKMVFGRFFPLQLNFSEFENVCQKDFCYKEIIVNSPGAKTLGVVFKKFKLTKGSEFYIINDEYNYVQGPITDESLSIEEEVISGLMPGDKLRLVLKEPIEEMNKSIVEIYQVSHGIIDFFRVFESISGRINSGPCYNCSASCNQNVKCNPNLDLPSKGTAIMLRKMNDNHVTWGTGALINNGSQNLRPLFLTVVHVSSEEFLEDMQFMFHYRSPECTPTTVGPVTMFVQGSSLLSISSSTELALLELSINPYNSTAFANNPVSYLGWSIVDQIPYTVTGIYHPLGDLQKHVLGGNVGMMQHGNQHVWTFDLVPYNGIYQSQSSGSPFLDDNYRVIGALSGKLTQPTFTCDGPFDGAFGGRLSKAWPDFCQFLDPNNEGIVAMNTIISSPGPKVFPNAHGPDLMCSSGNFILLNAPLDLPITWEVVQGANLVNGPSSGSGKSVTLTRAGSSTGQAKIRFTVQNLCSGNKIYEKNFWVGQPNSAGGISGSTYTYQYTNSVYSVNPALGASTYNWQIPNDWSGWSNTNAINVTVGSNSGYVSVTPQNSCGSGWTSSIYVTVNSCQFCRTVDVWPNPADRYISVVAVPNNDTQDYPKLELEAYFIYDVQGKLLAKKDKKMEINPNAIEVGGLPKGLYFIHLVIDNETVIKRLIIDR